MDFEKALPDIINKRLIAFYRQISSFGEAGRKISAILDKLSQEKALIEKREVIKVTAVIKVTGADDAQLKRLELIAQQCGNLKATDRYNAIYDVKIVTA